MMLAVLRWVCTSTTSAASWFLSCGRSRRVSVWIWPALAAPAMRSAANGAMKSFFNMVKPPWVSFPPSGKVETRGIRRQPDGAARGGTSSGAACGRAGAPPPLLLLDDQVARECVGLDHPFALAEAGLQP